MFCRRVVISTSTGFPLLKICGIQWPCLYLSTTLRIIPTILFRPRFTITPSTACLLPLILDDMEFLRGTPNPNRNLPNGSMVVRPLILQLRHPFLGTIPPCVSGSFALLFLKYAGTEEDPTPDCHHVSKINEVLF